MTSDSIETRLDLHYNYVSTQSVDQYIYLTDADMHIAVDGQSGGKWPIGIFKNDNLSRKGPDLPAGTLLAIHPTRANRILL